jgi:hypothetical protein
MVGFAEGLEGGYVVVDLVREGFGREGSGGEFGR